MTWTVRLHTIPKDKLKELLKYCQKAQETDPTFSYEEQGSLGEIKYVIIECESKNQAYRRGVLFHSRFGCFFEVEWK